MSNLGTVNDGNFQSEVIGREGLTLVDFWASWCGPCKMLAPTLEQVQSEMGDQVKIVKLNVEENPNTAMQYKVTNIPLMLLFKNGERVGQILGNVPKNKITTLIQDNA